MTFAATLSALAITVLCAPAAHAQRLYSFESTRALGLGGALRASATGSAGPLLNPSGMTLVRSYALEGAYQYVGPGPEHLGHASIVDSTSGFSLAGGLYYTYLNAKQKIAGESKPIATGHEVGVALALPFGDRVSLGATGKYVTLDAADARQKGITVDAGITVRPVSILNLGVVGYNLRDIDSPRHARALGWGVGLGGVEGLLVEVDGLVDLRSKSEGRGEMSLMGGAEYVLAQRAAIRVGGGRDGTVERGHLNAGASLLSEIGAIDAGVRRDVTGRGKETILSVSARLFVPSP